MGENEAFNVNVTDYFMKNRLLFHKSFFLCVSETMLIYKIYIIL